MIDFGARCRNDRVGEFSLGLLGFYKTSTVYLTALTLQGDGDGNSDCSYCGVSNVARGDLYAEGSCRFTIAFLGRILQDIFRLLGFPSHTFVEELGHTPIYIGIGDALGFPKKTGFSESGSVVIPSILASLNAAIWDDCICLVGIPIGCKTCLRFIQPNELKLLAASIQIRFLIQMCWDRRRRPTTLSRAGCTFADFDGIAVIFTNSGTATFVGCQFTGNTMLYGVVAAGDGTRTNRVDGMLVKSQGTSFSGNDATPFASLEKSNSPIFYRCDGTLWNILVHSGLLNVDSKRVIYCICKRPQKSVRMVCSDEALTVISYTDSLKASLAASLKDYPADSTILSTDDSQFLELQKVRELLLVYRSLHRS